MLSSLTLNNYKKVCKWIWTRILSEKIEQLGTNFKPNMSNLANDRVILKSNSSVLVQKTSIL